MYAPFLECNYHTVVHIVFTDPESFVNRSLLLKSCTHRLMLNIYN